MIKKTFKYYKKIVSGMKTRTIAGILSLIGFLISASRLVINDKPSTGDLIDVIVTFLTFFVWGFVGLLFIVRKESVGLFKNTEGPDAIVIGFFLLIVSWVVAIATVVRYFSGTFIP
jgi:hypothetical protein